LFHLTKAADGTDCTGVVPVMTISKAGGAFAAVNGGTVITELTNGWYKVVHAAADLDTVGCLGVRVAVATADTLNVAHQVQRLDINKSNPFAISSDQTAQAGAQRRSPSPPARARSTTRTSPSSSASWAARASARRA
jgi:hypothetical protein